MGMGMFSRKKSSGTPTSTAPATPSAIPVPVQSSRPPTSSSVMHSSPLASPFNAATSPFPPANSNGTPPGSSPVLEQVATNTDESATDDNTSTATTQVTGNGDASAAPAARPKPPASRRWSAFASATMASSAKSKLGQADDATASRPPSSAGVHPERPALTRPATASSMFGLGGKSSSAAPPPPPPASEDVGAGGSGGLGGNAPMSPEPEVKKKSKMSMGSATKSFMAFGGKKKK
ncbi:hypothetical protein DFH27DRAFT_574571 [Peziza echinospora]|nr:hypothetical protein DFH27DRAFT_574571 [Peziza echinospora]